MSKDLYLILSEQMPMIGVTRAANTYGIVKSTPADYWLNPNLT